MSAEPPAPVPAPSDPAVLGLTGWRAHLATHLRSGQVSRVVYGSIIGLALVLTLEAHPTTTGVVVGTLLATAVAVALAELYSEVLGARARRSMGGHHEPVRTIVLDCVAVAFGIAFPATFFVVSALGLMEQDMAFALAKWTGLGLIGGYGYVAARLTGTGPGGALVRAAGVAVIAAVLIAFKALLH
jgi:VIT1/CCC1 family predicted Fe2+/Mn2+ transporter